MKKDKFYESELYEILCSDSADFFYGAFNHTTTLAIDELIQLFPEMYNLDKSRDLNPILFRYKVKI